MPWRIRVTDSAKRDLLRLPGHVRQRARRILDDLAQQPRPPSARQLRGLPAHYRIALLRWRIIYRVEEESSSVLVLRVRQKTGPETYQDLDDDS